MRYICAFFALVILLAAVVSTQNAVAALPSENGLPDRSSSGVASGATSAGEGELMIGARSSDDPDMGPPQPSKPDRVSDDSDRLRSPLSARGAKTEAPKDGSDGTAQARKTIVIDPGHGGDEAGAVTMLPDGTMLREKDLALHVGLETAEMLRAEGYDVVLTRETDERVNRENRDLNGDGVVTVADDLQARVDIANEAQADLFVSVHFNSLSNTSTRGTEVIYNPQRPFAADSQRLAQHIHTRLLDALREGGYEPVDRGVRKDLDLLGYPLFVLAPQSKNVARAGQMPAALGEGLFLSNPVEKALLTDDEVLHRIARAYADAVVDYYR